MSTAAPAPSTATAATAATAATKPPPPWLRAAIRCQLRTESPLHCGDGGALAIATANWPGHAGSEGHINSVCQGRAQGQTRPYLPASTLRGSLRERCTDPARLFGLARGDQGQAGKVRVYDAFLTATSAPTGDRYWNPQRGTTLRTGVSLDPITGTAAASKLFTFEIVPAGAIAEVLIEADDCTDADLAELLGLIAGWAGDPASALGRGRGHGWGRIALVGQPSVAVLDAAGLAAWLKLPDSGTPPVLRPLQQPPAPIRVPAALLRWGFVLRPHSPLLVNEPGRAKAKAPGARGAQGENHEAALVYMQTPDGQQALVPGTSLRGALRGLARRILATIAHQHHGCAPGVARRRADQFLDQVFGTEGRRGLLWVGDATGPAKDHPQMFSAIDRFTAAVATEKMTIHGVLAANCEALDGDATLDLDPRRRAPPDGWQALLLLLARDLYAGDLVIGWGKSRGYGACDLVLKDQQGQLLADFPALMAAVVDAAGDRAAPGNWLRALHAALAIPVTDEQEKS